MTEPHANILALILAGGLGRRMEGRAKPLLSLGGRRLIDRVADVARAQCAAVALNLHEPDAETLAPFADLNLPVAPDAAPGRLGPLAGVLGGLDFAATHAPGVEFLLTLPCDCPFLPLAGVLGGLDFAATHAPGVEFLLTLPCDCPFLPGDLASRLLDAARKKTRSGLACAASGGRVHPVVALWPLTLRDNLRRALLENDIRGVGQFQRDYDMTIVEWPAAGSESCFRDPFFNVNTPEDLAQAEEMLRRSP
jgi:molybdenum cofactor guanylyltransferase